MVLGAALVLAACGADDGDTTDAGTDDAATTDDADGDAPADADGDLTIAFVSHTQDITDLFGQLKVGFEDTLADAGIVYDLISGAPPASDNHEAMDRILTDLQAASPDYIVFGPSSFELNQPRLVELEDAGTKIIMTDYPPPPEGFDIDPLTWVIYDHYDMGYLSAGVAAQQMCDEGRDFQVAMFYGPAASEISDLRMGGAAQALEDITAECGVSYEIVVEEFTEFNREMAFNRTEDVITAYPDVDVIVGANSNTALGIMEALVADGELDGRLVIGMGGQLDEMAAICRGEIFAAAFRDPRDMGMLAAEALIADLEGRQGDIPEVSFTDMPVLTDCDTIFEFVPRPILEQDDFRNNLLDGQWQD